MAADAAIAFHRVEPARLGDVLADAGMGAELVGGGNLQHRVPVDRRVVLRGGGLVGRGHARNADLRARARLALRAVHEPVAARPHLVFSGGQIRHDEPALIVGDDALDVADAEVTGFGDHPHAGLRAIRPDDGAADVVGIDRGTVWRARRAGGGNGSSRTEDHHPHQRGHRTAMHRDLPSRMANGRRLARSSQRRQAPAMDGAEAAGGE